MKQLRNIKKKVGSLLLAMAMIVTSVPVLSHEVYAEDNELPGNTQFATVDKLKSFNTNDNDGTINPAKVYFGNDNQQWWIAGSQQKNGLTLFAASPLATQQKFATDQNNKTYDTQWNCTYPNTVPTSVYSNHYGASPLRTTLQDLENSYFTSSEKNLMNDTTIFTNDTKNNSVYSTTNKLYPVSYTHLFPVLRKAVRAVTQSDSRGLLHVIDELRREDTPISRNIADHIDSFTDYDFAHLLFSDGMVENAISLDNQLNIIQVADLVLPDKDTTFEEYTCLLYTSHQSICAVC